MKKGLLTDIEGEILAETEKAVLLFDGKTQAWLPKSQVEIERMRGKSVLVTMSSDLAIDKGLA